MKIINKPFMLITLLGMVTIVLVCCSGGGNSDSSPWFEITANNNVPLYGTWVWTGSEILSWGGGYNTCINSGSRYNPSKNQWKPITTVGAPLPRCNPVSVWTGNKMIVWGGIATDGPSGGIYDPASDTWNTMSTQGTPTGGDILLGYGSAVWTGQEMIVWSGTDGGIYNPQTDTWKSISLQGVSLVRQVGPWCWTGTEMLANGWLYNPSTDTWRPINNNLGINNLGTGGVCTDKDQMFIAPTFINGVTTMGAKYNFATELWTTISSLNAPPSQIYHMAEYGRYRPAVVWTGTELWIVGGYPGGRIDYNYPPPPFLDGRRYNPITDTWKSTPTLPRDIGRGPSAWTGTEIILIYGQGGLRIKP